MICCNHTLNSPAKSNPLYRGVPPPIKIIEGYKPKNKDRIKKASKRQSNFHLPLDLKYIYAAAPLAYYLGLGIEASASPHMTFNSHEPLKLPLFPDFEIFIGQALRRTFYLDCAVRYASMTGKKLNGTDIRGLLGSDACEVFGMDMEDRFVLYSNALQDGAALNCPPWHMASYLDPVPESAESLPFLLRSLSAIYMPQSKPTSERGLVSMSVKEFLGRPSGICVEIEHLKRSIVVPSLREAQSQLWFAPGFPVDAVKASTMAFMNRSRYAPAKNTALVAIICNEDKMSGEIKVIKEALAGSHARIKVHRNIGVSGFTSVFAHGYDLVQFVGHCDSGGFKCRDGYVRASDIDHNSTPMFFFNSCASHVEAARLIEKGSVCGISTLFRVLEEAALDVCRNFYVMLGAGYPASLSLSAARECSALGKEYMLIGDGSYTCFDGDPTMPFFKVEMRDGKYSLRCTMGNTDKGCIVALGSSGRSKTSDLGFETRPMPAGHLARIAGGLKGYCLYHKNIYPSVEAAARQIKIEERRR